MSVQTFRYASSLGSSSVAMTRSRSPAIDPGDNFAWGQTAIQPYAVLRYGSCGWLEGCSSSAEEGHITTRGFCLEICEASNTLKHCVPPEFGSATSGMLHRVAVYTACVTQASTATIVCIQVAHC